MKKFVTRQYKNTVFNLPQGGSALQLEPKTRHFGGFYLVFHAKIYITVTVHRNEVIRGSASHCCTVQM